MNEENISQTPSQNSASSTPERTGKQKTESTTKSFFKEIVTFALIALCVVLPFRMFIAEPYIVSGTSMDPTFTTGDYLIVDKLSYEIGEPKRNSVVVFKFPDPTVSKKNLIKRIIGLPGETVKMEGQQVTIINTEHPEGFVLNQKYLAYPVSASFTTTLGAGQYFVMGDNRPVSYDSRAWGVLPREDIVGRPLIRLLPFTEIGILPGDHSSEIQDASE